MAPPGIGYPLKRAAVERAEAQHSAQTGAALLGMVSHELRTPLQKMLNHVELLSVRDLPPGVAQAAARLVQDIELITGRLDNIAKYTRLTSGAIELKREPFSVGALLTSIAAEHSASAESQGQTIDVQMLHHGDLQALGDAVRLRQIVDNYVTNAIKYAGPVRITILGRVLKHRFADGAPIDGLEVTVEDEGPGLSHADSRAVWEPFVRGKGADPSRKGSGLGLAVVKLLADAAGWEVGVRSESGQGSTFFVLLPLGQAVQPAETKPS